MKYALYISLLSFVFVSCKQNSDEEPFCLISNNPSYFYYNNSNRFAIPNAFTPNGDGKNDTYKPVGNLSQIASFRLTIFDKEGQNLFETVDAGTPGWDGRNRAGDKMAPGRYIAKVSYQDVYYGQRTEIQYCFALLSYGSGQCIPQSADGPYYFEDMFDPYNQYFHLATSETLCP